MQYVQVSTNIIDVSIKTCNLRSVHSHGKRLYGHIFDMVDTAFSYCRALIVCYFLQESSKVKESTLHVICNAHTAFLLCLAVKKVLM